MTRITLAAALAVLSLSAPAFARDDVPVSDAVRRRAEQACYDDVNRLCAEAIPDEKKIETCMKVHRAQLSPKCRSIFDTATK